MSSSSKFRVGERVVNCEGRVFTITRITPFTEEEQEFISDPISIWYWDDDENTGYQESSLTKLTKLDKLLLE